jgi:DNA repair protein RecO (recombination protein O)
MGRVHGIAKGAKRLKGAFRGGVDALVLGQARIYARRGSAELRVIGSFDATEPFSGLRGRLSRFHGASHVAALLLAFTHEEQPHPELFDLATAALRLLASADDDSAEAYAAGFEAMALGLLGFAPELTRCADCGRPARNVVTARVSPLKGGLLCSQCRSADPRAPELSGEAVAALRALSAGPIVDAPALGGAPPVLRAVRDALDRWSETLIDRPLRTSRTAHR